MNRVITLLLLVLPTIGFAQLSNLRSFDQVSLDFGTGEGLSTTSISYGQELIIAKPIQYSFGFDMRLNYSRLNVEGLPPISNAQNSISFGDKSNNVFLSLPLRASIGTRNFQFGGAFDLATLSLGPDFGSESMVDDGTGESMVLSPKGASWALSKKERQRNLTNQLYIAYTFDQSVSIQLGLKSQFVNYNLRQIDEDGVRGDSKGIFGQSFRYPFIRLVFFDEK